MFWQNAAVHTLLTLSDLVLKKQTRKKMRCQFGSTKQNVTQAKQHKHIHVSTLQGKKMLQTLYQKVNLHD